MNLILKFMITTAILENTVLLSLSTINKLKIKKMKDGRPIWTVQIEIIHSPAVRNHFLSENPNIILISTKIYKNIVYYQVEFLLFSEVRFNNVTKISGRSENLFAPSLWTIRSIGP